MHVEYCLLQILISKMLHELLIVCFMSPTFCRLQISKKYFPLAPALPYHCDICDKSFTSKRGFHIHSNLHRGIYPYHCPLCDRGFAASVNLTQHLARQHPGDSLPCHHCDMTFATVGQYRGHLKDKHGVKGTEWTRAAMTTRADPRGEAEDVPQGIYQVQTGTMKTD